MVYLFFNFLHISTHQVGMISSSIFYMPGMNIYLSFLPYTIRTKRVAVLVVTWPCLASRLATKDDAAVDGPFFAPCRTSRHGTPHTRTSTLSLWRKEALTVQNYDRPSTDDDVFASNKLDELISRHPSSDRRRTRHRYFRRFIRFCAPCFPALPFAVFHTSVAT